MKRLLALTFFLALAALSSRAQGKLFTVSASPGLMFYQGDLSSSIPQWKTTHFSFEIAGGYRFSNLFRIQLGYLRGKISGADSLVSGHELRNLHFESGISDFRLLGYLDLFELWHVIKPSKLLGQSEYRRRFIGPDIIGGIGVTRFNPKASLDGAEYVLHSLGTEGQFVEGGDYPAPYKRWQFNVKFGAGMGIRLAAQWQLEAEFIYHVYFSDYLDDVSGPFPDYDDIMSLPNGEVVAHFAFGGRDAQNFEEGKMRGNPNENDRIVTFGLKLTYLISRDQVDKLKKL